MKAIFYEWGEEALIEQMNENEGLSGDKQFNIYDRDDDKTTNGN